jgi:hypothetical protein
MAALNALHEDHPLQLARNNVSGIVFAGVVQKRGRIIRVAGATCMRLVRAGCFAVSVGPDGGRMYRITDFGRECARTGSIPGPKCKNRR